MEPTTITYYGRIVQGTRRCICRTKLSYIYVFTHDGFSSDAWLPHTLLRWTENPFALPKRFVIKLYDHLETDTEDEHDVWNTERTGYQRMMCLQGIFIPRCYGQITIQGSKKRALAFQHLDGIDLLGLLSNSAATKVSWSTDEICVGISRCFSEISKCHVVHCDVDPTKLNNLMFAKASYPALALNDYAFLAVVTIGLSAQTLGIFDWTALYVCITFASMIWIVMRYLRPSRPGYQVYLIDFGDWELCDDLEACQRWNMAAARNLREQFTAMQSG